MQTSCLFAWQTTYCFSDWATSCRPARRISTTTCLFAKPTVCSIGNQGDCLPARQTQSCFSTHRPSVLSPDKQASCVFDKKCVSACRTYKCTNEDLPLQCTGVRSSILSLNEQQQPPTLQVHWLHVHSVAMLHSTIHPQ